MSNPTEGRTDSELQCAWKRRLYAGEVAIPRRRSKKRGTVLSVSQRVLYIEIALRSLRGALDGAKVADAPLLAGKIRAAITSCKGALNHAEKRMRKEARKAAQAMHDREAEGSALACTHEIRRP